MAASKKTFVTARARRVGHGRGRVTISVYEYGLYCVVAEISIRVEQVYCLMRELAEALNDSGQSVDFDKLQRDIEERKAWRTNASNAVE